MGSDPDEKTSRGQTPFSPTPFQRKGLIHRLWFAPAFSPTGLLVRAALFVGAYLVLELAGLRAYVTVLSGNITPARLPQDLYGALGVIYLFFYLLAVIVSPILLLAAALLALVQTFVRTDSPQRHRGHRETRNSESRIRGIQNGTPLGHSGF